MRLVSSLHTDKTGRPLLVELLLLNFNRLNKEEYNIINFHHEEKGFFMRRYG